MFHLKQSILTALLSLGLFASCDTSTTGRLAQPTLLPMPAEVVYNDGYFTLSPKTTITFEDVDQPLVEHLHGSLLKAWNIELARQEQGGDIQLTIKQGDLAPEGYSLEVSSTGIRLMASTSAGLQNGVKTLLQLCDEEGRLPAVQINDEPRFAYRGVMLDVSRHFIDKEHILMLVDEMAKLKFNRLHLHLVDGGGWRMEVDSYPRLMTHATYRTERGWDKWWHGGDRRFVPAGTPGAYGGYYTKAELRELVAHAAKQGITIVPEIEMPGHSNEVAAAYPELFCGRKWAKDVSDVCIGKEETFTFFERILDETMELFPSEYIHIGGDEAAMNHWGQCLDCQRRMRVEGLKDLHELQSYMIRRIERYLKSKGRKLIGWDEILMGGLAPEATVMSWRGERGGIESAEAGHDVVMTPNGYLYLDYYQTYGEKQPRAIGGYVPLEKVYSYDPVPSELSPERRHHILGVQANLWTEYVESEEHMWYMLFPRLLALSEVAWTKPERKDYADFRTRATRYNDALRTRGINAYPLTGVDATIDRGRDGAMSLSMNAEHAEAEIRYTTDGTEPTASSSLYTAPIIVTDSVKVVAKPFGKSIPSDVASRVIRLDKHLALDKTVRYDCKWNERYPAAGAATLVDGIKGTPTYLDGKWQGFTEPMDVTIDLGEIKPVRHVFARFMQEREQWVYMPKFVEVWVGKTDKEWIYVGKVATETDESNPRPVFETFDFYLSSLPARYVRMRAEIGRSPGHFIFTDEVVVW